MSISNDEIKKLGELAKIEVADSDIEGFRGDLESILAYVDQVQAVDTENVEVDYFVKNVVREDVDPIIPGTHTDDILAEAPDTQDGFIKVKKIL
jgi:aspartyl-tRNA(Asn)/glutamyl-tRNA(Gln) amidotransferase subunit C